MGKKNTRQTQNSQKYLGYHLIFSDENESFAGEWFENEMSVIVKIHLNFWCRGKKINSRRRKSESSLNDGISFKPKNR